MGVHYRWPIPDVVQQQLRLAHTLREELVALELDYQAAVKMIWSSYPAVAAAEEGVAAAEAAARAALEVVVAERARLRTKRVRGALADGLSAAHAALRAARQARRDAIAAVPWQATGRIREATTELRDAQKRLYTRFCQQGDLCWATHNQVVAQHVAAVKRIRNARTLGRSANLRHRSFDATGTIAVTLMRNAGQPARNPRLLADPDGKYRNVLVLPWIDPSSWEAMSRAEQRRRGRVTVRMRCGSVAGEPAWIDVPVQQHRMLEADADIIRARLTVTRTAGHRTARLTITAKMPDPPPVDDGPTVAIHLGWLDTDNGTQIATWRSTAPLDIPVDLRTVITTHPETTTGTITMPQRITDRIARTDQLRSQRDLARDAMRAKLVAWLSEHGTVPHPNQPDTMIGAADVANWRAPARFAALAVAWRAAPPPDGHDIANILESWRRPDRALWERQACGHGKALRHRNDLYRQVAAVVCSQAGRIVIDDTSLAVIAALPTQLPADTATRIAHRRTIAAPGTLRTAITTTATREGIPVSVVPAAGLSRTHARCGYENRSDERYLTRPVTCDGCGATYDPDASATLLMLQRASTQPPSPATE